MAVTSVSHSPAPGGTSGIQRTPLRREVKIPVPAGRYHDVLAWVRLHPAHWRSPYPPRQINNIYFDTPTYAGLKANLAGIGDRAKLRLRWYGESLAHVVGGQLELKQKRGRIGWKESVSVDLDVDLGRICWSDLSSTLAGSAGALGRRWCAEFPVPVLINAYRRDYYATPDGVVRLTVDRDLRAFGQRSTAVPNLRAPEVSEDLAIIELKAPEDAVALMRLDDALSNLPVTVGRYSKYVSGVLATPDFV